MSEISKKVAYIKGMAEGMELTADTAKDAKDKLLLQMLDALDLIAEELDSIRDRQDEAERYIDELDSDLGELEEAVFEEDDEDEDEDCGCGCHHHHGQDEDEDEDEEDEDEDDSLDFIEYECPHCGALFVPTMADYVKGLHTLTRRRLTCPACGKTSMCRHRVTR